MVAGWLCRRYDYADSDGNGVTGEWIGSWEDGSGLDDPDPRAVTCDESHPMLYTGYDSITSEHHVMIIPVILY